MHIDRFDPHLHGWCLAESGSFALDVGGMIVGRFALTPTRPDVVAAFGLSAENVGFDLPGGACLLALRATFPDIAVRFADAASGEELLTLPADEMPGLRPETQFRGAGPEGCCGIRWVGLEWLGDDVVLKGACSNSAIEKIEVFEISGSTLRSIGRVNFLEAGFSKSFSLKLSGSGNAILFVFQNNNEQILGLDWLFAGYVLSKDYFDQSFAVSTADHLTWLGAVQRFGVAERSAFLRVMAGGARIKIRWDDASAGRVPSMFLPLVDSLAEDGHEVCDRLCGVLWAELLEACAALPSPARVQLRKIVYDELAGKRHVIEPPTSFPPELAAYARCVIEPGGLDGDRGKPLLTLKPATFARHRITRLQEPANAASRSGIHGALLGPITSPATEWRVSVAVSFRDRARMTCDFLLSLISQTGRGFLEIILIDNQSTDEERAAVDAFVAEMLAVPEVGRNVVIKIIDYPAPFNHSTQTNMAVAAATNDHILLTNNDIFIPDQDVLAGLVPFLEHPTVATVGCVVLSNKEGSISVRRFMSAGMFLKKSFDPLCEPPLHEDRLPVAIYPEAILTHGNTFGFCLVRKSVYEGMGAADETLFPADYNDLDFCLRTSAAGYHHVTSLRHYVHHRARATRGSTPTPSFEPAVPVDLRKVAAQGFRFWKK